MQDTKTTDLRTTTDQVLATRRRARRGLVAGYIHQLSARHTTTPASAPQLIRPAVERVRAA